MTRVLTRTYKRPAPYDPNPATYPVYIDGPVFGQCWGCGRDVRSSGLRKTHEGSYGSAGALPLVRWSQVYFSDEHGRGGGGLSEHAPIVCEYCVVVVMPKEDAP